MILSEIGTDMSGFATAAHLISSSGLCPKNDESALIVVVALAAALRADT